MLDETNLYVDGSKDRQTDRLTHRYKLILSPARDLKKKANLKWKGKAKRGQDKILNHQDCFYLRTENEFHTFNYPQYELMCDNKKAMMELKNNLTLNS